MVSDAIYELIRVELVERIDDNTIDCLQLPSGFFRQGRLPEGSRAGEPGAQHRRGALSQ